MIYIASPYSSESPAVVEDRYRTVARFVDLLITDGFIAFSPIVYCHPIAQRIGFATDAQTWHAFNMAMLRKAEACYVLRLPGWQLSKGVQMEMRVCNILGMPCVHYDEGFELVTQDWRAVCWERRDASDTH